MLIAFSATSFAVLASSAAEHQGVSTWPLPTLALDDECSFTDGGHSSCALHALQRQGLQASGELAMERRRLSPPPQPPGPMESAKGLDSKESWDPPELPAHAFDDDAAVCWKGTYGRGAGKPLTTCNASGGMERSGALCYPRCRNATPPYHGSGPMCWQQCEEGYVNMWAYCRRRGWLTGHRKHGYTRGWGRPMLCAEGLQEDAGLCYPPCKLGWVGAGPLCWKSCSGGRSVSGGAICCTNSSACSSKILHLATDLPWAVAKAMLLGSDGHTLLEEAAQAVSALLGFAMPLCSNLGLGPGQMA